MKTSRTTLETSEDEFAFRADNSILFVLKYDDKFGLSNLEIFSSESGKDKALKLIQQVLKYDCKFLLDFST